MMSDDTLSSKEADDFRERCRVFLIANSMGGDPANFEDNRAFLAAASEAGLAGIAYPREFGGAGLSAAHDRIWREEKAAFPYADRLFIISHGMCLPIINEYGTDAQRLLYEADMISGRTLWCQMFSEPGAGSDVAGLQMTATRDGDEWVLNGQKVWTTYAHLAQYGVVIARTDPSVPKHAGISMFIVDLGSIGVDIRPIVQIDQGREFNEVFFSDVRIPAANIIGSENDGWRLATSMLMYERIAIGSGQTDQITQPRYEELVSAARRRGLIDDPILRDKITSLYILETCKSLVALRNRDEAKAGKTPGPAGSLGKLLGSTIEWEFRAIAYEVIGPPALAWEESSTADSEAAMGILTSFRVGIAGGTDEIQRNIIGDRVLGLPREPVTDRDTPYRDLIVGTVR
jgi:alkylation response protein AidB-like acyl-CoA dehydrogenase